MLRKILYLITAIVVSTSSQVSAEQSIPLGYPSKIPELTVNKVPALCEKILQLARTAYSSDDPYPRIIEDTYMHILPEVDEWHGLTGIKFDRIRYETAEGLKENWAAKLPDSEGGRRYFLSYSLSRYDVEQQILEIVEFNTPPEIIDGSDIHSNYQEDGAWVVSESSNHKVVKGTRLRSADPIIPIVYKSDFYVVRSISSMMDVVRPVVVSRLGETSSDVVCRTSGFLNFDGRLEIEDAGSLAPELKSLPRLFFYSNKIMGEDFRPGRRFSPFPVLRRYAIQKIMQSYYRPWSIEADVENDLTDPMSHEGILATWKYEGPWQFRQYKEFTKAVWATREELKKFYQDRLELPASNANQLSQRAMGEYLDVLISGEMRSERREKNGWLNQPHWQLRKVLLDGIGEGKLEELLNQTLQFHLEGENSNPSAVVCDGCEPAIFYALESNDVGLKILIKRGVEINRVNRFGKSPLMMAAHMNNEAAVGALLAAGADVHLRTGQVFFLPKLKYLDRTALMYAAENASPQTVRLLLAAGSDPGAEDSKGRTMSDYLALNTRLSPLERSEIEEVLLAAMPD